MWESKGWFRQMRNTILLDKKEKGAVEGQRAEGGCGKKRHPYFTYSRGSLGDIEKISRTTKEETDEMKDRISYPLKSRK